MHVSIFKIKLASGIPIILWTDIPQLGFRIKKWHTAASNEQKRTNTSSHSSAGFNSTKVRLSGLTSKVKKCFSVGHCCSSGLLASIASTIHGFQDLPDQMGVDGHRSTWPALFAMKLETFFQIRDWILVALAFAALASVLVN